LSRSGPAPLLAGDDNFLKRFHREALVARVLASPHTVKVLASGNEKGTHYLVLEFVEGLTSGMSSHGMAA
jgi:serine/threonine-protein kinase